MFGLFSSRSSHSQPSVSAADALRSIPAINPGVTFETDGGGRLVAHVPVSRRKGFWGRFQKPVSIHRVRLDEIGKFVIERINGERTVQDLVDVFSKTYRVNGREAKLCMADFLKSLAQRNIISIGVVAGESASTGND
ncbi:MAG: PqqD family protein [Lentisphaerae bacterium]|jgi:hypothetical protein|nr:PqqD family protein [Lentisphaerota bacterium]